MLVWADIHWLVASYFDCGDRSLLSFDTASAARAVAHVLRLQVFPQLSVRDQAFVAALR